MPVVELNRGERRKVARTPRREERSFDILTAKVVGINKPLEIGQRNSTVGKKTLVACSNIWPWLRAGRLRVWVPVQVQTGGGGDAWEWRARVATAGRGPWATGHRHQPSSYIHTWGTKGANENRSAVQGGRKDGTTILVRPDRQRTRSWRWRRRWRQRRRGWEWEREQAWVRARLLGRVRGQECRTGGKGIGREENRGEER